MIGSSGINTSNQLLQDKIAIFKMIPENRCEAGKALTSEARMKNWKKIKSL